MSPFSWVRFLFLPVLAGTLALSLASPAHAGDPLASGYRLTAPPLKIHERLGELGLGPVPPLGKDERRLLTAAWELNVKGAAAGKVDETMLLDAVLLASGVEKVEARRTYREQFERLVAGARKAVAGARDKREVGARLMTYLHKAAMGKGYETKQSSLAVLLDTGRYNCVSASTLYYLAGSRLGLDLRILSIPGGPYSAGHATLDLIDGKQRVEVEATNPDGFDWRAKVNRPGVVVFGLVPDRKKATEVPPLALAAMIYSNRGTDLGSKEAPRPLESARHYLCALALSPSDAMATNNLVAVLVNWGPRLSKQGKHEEAVSVLGFGVALSPKSAALRQNQSWAWERYIEAQLEAGKDAEALKLSRRAARIFPSDRSWQNEARWFSRHADKVVREKGWEAGLAVVDRGLKVLSADEGKHLVGWRSGMFRRWSQERLDKKDVAGSQAVLARGHALNREDRAIHAGIAYHTQRALSILESQAGREAMLAHHAGLRKQFPEVKGVSEAGWSHAVRAIDRLAEEKKFPEAVAAVEHYLPLAGPDRRAELGGIAYDRWAHHLARSKEWQAALDKYAEGLKAFPGQRRLVNNALATVDDWARPAMGAGNWNEASRIYRVGLKCFPGNGHLEHNLRYCESRKKQGK